MRLVILGQTGRAAAHAAARAGFQSVVGDMFGDRDTLITALDWRKIETDEEGLPDASGTLQAVETLAQAEDGVVLMSGFNEQEVFSQFAEKGSLDFLQKPFGFEAMNKVVQGVLAGAPQPK